MAMLRKNRSTMLKDKNVKIEFATTENSENSPLERGVVLSESATADESKHTAFAGAAGSPWRGVLMRANMYSLSGSFFSENLAQAMFCGF
jgi:hypothetical protein